MSSTYGTKQKMGKALQKTLRFSLILGKVNVDLYSIPKHISET